jgi:hypothetical protein
MKDEEGRKEEEKREKCGREKNEEKKTMTRWKNR